MSVGRIWHIRAGMCRKEERHDLLRMILKMTGGAMVFAGGSGFGLWLAGKRKRRIEILRSLRRR